MNERSTQQNNALAGLIIQTDIAFWRLLLQSAGKSHKFTRTEAFYDLIDRHCIALLKGEGDHIGGTINSLAKTWGWDRETVARFIDNLQQLGTVTVDTDGNRKVIRLNCVTLQQSHPEASEKPSDVKTPSSVGNGAQSPFNGVTTPANHLGNADDMAYGNSGSTPALITGLTESRKDPEGACAYCAKPQ